jgi:hypothetical protein
MEMRDVRINKGIKMSETRNLTINFPQTGKSGLVMIRDGIAILKMNDAKVTRRLCDAEKKLGKNVAWDEKLRAMVEAFPGKTALEIDNILTAELRRHGAKYAGTH